ncbi:hypothetical protein [Herbiconiux daphne]|uniref:Uncharacterized protein n=1 Tax=Herbiconiux daphne TaxID=2970914 RepID=A0ABT2HAI6_9MICO|nr:hypothetical protein [Herbiconiux daphne]MCS5736965.1 hypothetical protein [Herbiconiux daphne]
MADSTVELIRKLTQLEGKLLKEFIKESDPDNWVGRRQISFDLTEKQKNVRLLDKNNAKSTYAILKAVQERRKDLSAPIKKGEAQPVAESDLITQLNAQAAEHFKHLQSLN